MSAIIFAGKKAPYWGNVCLFGRHYAPASIIPAVRPGAAGRAIHSPPTPRTGKREIVDCSDHLCGLAVYHVQDKPIGPDGECRDDPYEYAGDEQNYCRHHIVEKDR